MRLNGNSLSTTNQRGWCRLRSCKLLVIVGYAGFVSLAGTVTLSAQVTTAPAPVAPADATGTPAAGNPQNQNPSDQDGQVPALLDQSSVDQIRAQVPPISQNPANPTPTNIPQFPTQPGNPISPYNSSSANPQSPQLTAPSLYLTGSNDLNQISTASALSQAFSEQGAAGFYSEPLADYDHPPIERVRLGPFDLRAAVVTSVVGDDNPRTSTGASGGTYGGSKDDVSFAVTPAILLQYGDHDGQKGFASLSYTPTFTRFVHHSDENTDDYENFAFNALYPFQRLTLNLTQTYTETTGVNSDSNVRTTQTSRLSLIGASYEVDDKISTSTQLQELINKYGGPSGQGGGGGEGENITTLNNNATYRLSEKLTVGPSLNLGIDKPDDISQQTFEQTLLGINYAPTEKIGLYLQGGAEFRQYEHQGTDVNPIFSTGIGYTPFDSTVLSINASQSIHTDTNTATTSETNQTVIGTDVGASITQRIAQRYFLSFDFDYSHTDSQAGTGNVGAMTTTQDTLTYRPSFQFAPTGWSSVSLYYQYLSNDSNMPGSSYYSNQIGISLTAQF